MRHAGIKGSRACPEVHHSFGVAAVTASVPLPTVAAVLGHADSSTNAVHPTTIGAEAREFIARVWA